MAKQVTPWMKEADRMEMLDRLGRSGCKYVVWKPVNQIYEVTWDKTSRMPTKKVTLCARSGRLIKSNCETMTEAAIDVRIRVLFNQLNFDWRRDL